MSASDDYTRGYRDGRLAGRMQALQEMSARAPREPRRRDFPHLGLKSTGLTSVKAFRLVHGELRLLEPLVHRNRMRLKNRNANAGRSVVRHVFKFFGACHS